MNIPIMLSDLSEELRAEIISNLSETNPDYLQILEEESDAVAYIDLDELAERNNYVYHWVEMNETEEEVESRPGFILCRSYYVMENYNCPDICVCLDVGEDRVKDIMNIIMVEIINGSVLKDFYQVDGEKLKLIDSDNGELIFIIIADQDGLVPEHRKCDPKFARQLDYIQYINDYYGG